MGEVVPARTSLTLLPHPLALCCHYLVSKCCSTSIVVTSTVRVKSELYLIQYCLMSLRSYSWVWHHAFPLDLCSWLYKVLCVDLSIKALSINNKQSFSLILIEQDKHNKGRDNLTLLLSSIMIVIQLAFNMKSVLHLTLLYCDSCFHIIHFMRATYCVEWAKTDNVCI